MHIGTASIPEEQIEHNFPYVRVMEKLNMPAHVLSSPYPLAADSTVKTATYEIISNTPLTLQCIKGDSNLVLDTYPCK